MRRIGIFLGFFFPVRSFCYRVLSFLFSLTPTICKLGVTWAFILIPSNQDVMYLFYAFDSFPVTYVSVYLRINTITSV